MTIMITGASGFLGLATIEALLAGGLDVVGFSRTRIAEPRLAGLPGRLIPVAGDVRDGDALRAAMRDHGVTAIVHMAAITADAARERRDAADVIAVNLGGLAETLAAARDAGVARFVYTGSIAVFGPDTPDHVFLDEERAHDPRTLYAITKSSGEAIVARLGDLFGLDWAVARIGRVFGPYEHETGVRDTMSQIYQATMLARAGRAASLARPCVKNWNYARDTAADLVALVTAAALPRRIYNLGASNAWSLADWCALLARRHPGFRYAVGPDASGHPVDLGGTRDAGFLGYRRFADDLRRPPARSMAAAFDDYMTYLDSSEGRAA